MPSSTNAQYIRPEVLSNLYPTWDKAGNKLQKIHLRFACGHEETYYSLDLGKGWKPRSKAQIFRDELQITCPKAYKVCRACAEAQP